MWFYGPGWYWWWLGFVVVFLVIPALLGIARGWRPWAHHREPIKPGSGIAQLGKSDSWGSVGMALWVLVFLSLLWLLAGIGTGVGWFG
jgi:hypothetical protein